MGVGVGELGQGCVSVPVSQALLCSHLVPVSGDGSLGLPLNFLPHPGWSRDWRQRAGMLVSHTEAAEGVQAMWGRGLLRPVPTLWPPL